MGPYLQSVLAVAFTIGLAVLCNRITNGAIDLALFIAGSALWWGVRAFYVAEVNTAHKSKSEG